MNKDSGSLEATVSMRTCRHGRIRWGEQTWNISTQEDSETADSNYNMQKHEETFTSWIYIDWVSACSSSNLILVISNLFISFLFRIFIHNEPCSPE